MNTQRLEGDALLEHAALVAAALTERTNTLYAVHKVDSIIHCVQLVASGHTVELNSSWEGKGRMRVTGQYPVDGQYRTPRDWGAIPYGATSPAITYAWSRAPKAIAGQIANRFLPEFLPILAKCREVFKERREWVASRGEVTARLSEVLGLRQIDTKYRSDDTPKFSVSSLVGGHGYGEIIVNGPQSVTFELNSLPAPLALALASFLKIYTATEQVK